MRRAPPVRGRRRPTVDRAAAALARSGRAGEERGAPASPGVGATERCRDVPSQGGTAVGHGRAPAVVAHIAVAAPGSCPSRGPDPGTAEGVHWVRPVSSSAPDWPAAGWVRAEHSVGRSPPEVVAAPVAPRALPAQMARCPARSRIPLDPSSRVLAAGRHRGRSLLFSSGSQTTRMSTTLKYQLRRVTAISDGVRAHAVGLQQSRLPRTWLARIRRGSPAGTTAAWGSTGPLHIGFRPPGPGAGCAYVGGSHSLSAWTRPAEHDR